MLWRLKLAEFWNSILTEKSWDILINLSKENFNFIVIGGWAAYLWTKTNKSKDIDIALADIKDINFLKNKYNLKKNDRLKKYEISFNEIDVDIYVPYFSELPIPVQDLKQYYTKIEGLNVVNSEMLLILKQAAELDRESSVRCEKDRVDIMTLLLHADINLKLYYSFLRKYKLEHYLLKLKNIVADFKDNDYLELNPRELKLKKIKILKKLKEI